MDQHHAPIVKINNPSTISVTISNTQKINVLNSELIKKSLLKLVKIPGIRLAIDLSEINFIDSSGFDVLNFLALTAFKNKSSLELCEVNSSVIELIDLVRKYQKFQIRKIKPRKVA